MARHERCSSHLNASVTRSKQDLSSVFAVVRKHLTFDPATIEDEDLKSILSGFITVVGAIARLRTHASSAHAQATTKRTYKLEPRHARPSVMQPMQWSHLSWRLGKSAKAKDKL
jgi:hypothetical protein